MKNNAQENECRIHGTGLSAGNRMLILMILASACLVVWHVWVYGPSSSAVISESSGEPFLTALGSEIWDLFFSRKGIVAELYDVAAYFLIGILLAGLIRTYKLAIILRDSLIRYGVLSIFIASFVGVLTPLCSCGILTTVITLLFAGLPLAPAMALLVSSPLISPSAFMLTLNDLGPQWTAIRVIASLLMGIFAGVVTHLIRNRGFRTENLLLDGAVPEGSFHDRSYPDNRLKCNCKEKFGNRVAAKTDNRFIIFLAKSYDMLWLVGKYVLVGVAVGTIVERYIPYEWIYKLFGKDDKLNIIWITLGTIPIFLHQISASSILFHIKSSIDGTLNGGAGLAFLIGGPVTAIPAMAMLWALFKKRVFFLYMFVSIAGTILLAYSFQYFVFVPYVDTDNPLLEQVSSVSGGRSSVIIRTDKTVRIVMNPDGRNMIAIRDNYLEGGGNVVFDAGPGRFLNDAAGKYGNRKYVKNIAEWLEESATQAKERSILIYNTFNGSGLDNSHFDKNATETLKGSGDFKVRITDRTDTPEITRQLLEEYSQLWVIFGGAGPEHSFSEAETAVITGFTENGGGLLIVAGQPRDGPDNGITAASRLSSEYGVIFSGSVENNEELRVSILSRFLNRLSRGLSVIYKN